MLQVRVLCSTQLCILGAEEKGRAIREAMVNREQSMLPKKKKKDKKKLAVFNISDQLHP